MVMLSLLSDLTSVTSAGSPRRDSYTACAAWSNGATRASGVSAARRTSPATSCSTSARGWHACHLQVTSISLHSYWLVSSIVPLGHVPGSS